MRRGSRAVFSEPPQQHREIFEIVVAVAGEVSDEFDRTSEVGQSKFGFNDCRLLPGDIIEDGCELVRDAELPLDIEPAVEHNGAKLR